MTQIKCPECKMDISDQVKFCPNCGCHMTRKKVRISKKAVKYARLLEERENRYGNLSQVVLLYSANSPHNIYVYEESQTIFIQNKPYKFSDILYCHIDTRTYVPNKERYTKEKHGEIGISIREKIHYYVFIGVTDILNPLVTIHLGQRITLANEICSLMNGIIRSNSIKLVSSTK